MKIKVVLCAVVLTLASVGMGTSALASANKYADYRAAVEATKGASVVLAATSTRYYNYNKYARDIAEKSGLGGIMLPTVKRPRWGSKYADMRY